MHSAVMQNKKYIKFAFDNAVDVLTVSRIEEGVQKGDRKAKSFKLKKGDDTEYLVSWPSLTLDDLKSLNRSKAATYNKTGKIPYTSIVDPYTLEEIEGILGGTSAKGLMAKIAAAKKALVKEHGPGLKRSVLAKIDKAIASATAQAEADDFAKAMKTLGKVSGQKAQPEAIQEKLAKAREAVVALAEKRIEQIKAMDAKKAKREASRLKRKLKGTGLEEALDGILASH